MFTHILRCPESSKEQNISSHRLSCQNPFTYHCLPDQNGKIGEICLDSKWIPAGYCPVYSTNNKVIDVIPCDNTLGICPRQLYLSNDVLSYSSCVRSASIPSPSDTKHTTTTPSSTSTFPVAAVVAPVIIIILVISVLAIIYWKRRPRKQSEGSPDEQQQMIDIEGLSEKEQRKIGLQGKRVLITQRKEEEEKHDIFLVPDDKPVYCETEMIEFVKTTHFSKIKEHIQKGEFVLILGDMGAGKTTTCQMLCHEFHRGTVLKREVKCRMINSLKNASFKINQKNSHLLFLDDCFEHWNYFPDKREKDIELIQEMFYKWRKHCVVVMTMTHVTWRVHAQNIIGLKCFSNRVILSDLSDIEKEEIMKVQLKLHGIPVETEVLELTRNGNLSEKKENTVKYSLRVGFPLTCRIFCSTKAMSVMLGANFFKDPVSEMKDNIRRLKMSDKQEDVDHYVTLVYILLKGMLDVQTLDEKLLTDIRDKCKNGNDKYKTDKSFEFRRNSHYLSVNSKGNAVFMNEFVHKIVMLDFACWQTGFYVRYCRGDYLLQNIQLEATRESPLRDWHLLIRGNFYSVLLKRLKTFSESVEGHVVFQDERFQSIYEQA